MSVTLDWGRARLHPIDERTQRLDVPFPEQLAEPTRQALAAAVVNLEVVGGPIEGAKLGHDHFRMEITLDADMQEVERLLRELVDGVVSRTGET